MKKLISLILVLAMMLSAALVFTSCDNSADYTVGVCQLMEHDSLDAATNGFVDALKAELEAAGKTVDIDVQVAGGQDLCTTVINTFTAKQVDLIMANATPALLAASNATDSIPILGTSVTDYNDTFKSGIPSNVSGTSDAVDFAAQAQMMIDTLGLKAGDKVGILYCINESNSKVQSNAVSAYFAEKSITTEEYTFSEVNELQAVVNGMVSECKAVYVPSDNTVANNDTIVGEICNAEKVPVYTSYGSSIGYAGLAIDYYALGKETGKMAAQILLGEKTPSDLTVKTITPSKSFNNEICELLDITVPAN